jgi:dUTP pyrophosphatase
VIRVEVRRLDSAAALPAYAREGDAGLDLHTLADVTLPPSQRVLVGTGLAIAIPAGYAGLVLPRSGLALTHGVTVLNAPGLVDAGYRGELKVLLINHGDQPVTLRRGERVAQLVIQRIEHAELVEVVELPPSARGAGGFGSTGTGGSGRPPSPP